MASLASREETCPSESPRYGAAGLPTSCGTTGGSAARSSRMAPTGRCPWDQDRPSVQKDHYLFGSGLACMLHKSIPVGVHAPYTNTAWRPNMPLLRRRIPRNFNELEKSDHMWTMWVFQREGYKEFDAAGSSSGHGISLHSKIGSDCPLRGSAWISHPHQQLPLTGCRSKANKDGPLSVTLQSSDTSRDTRGDCPSSNQGHG